MIWSPALQARQRRRYGLGLASGGSAASRKAAAGEVALAGLGAQLEAVQVRCIIYALVLIVGWHVVRRKRAG
jgi:hypothetical protein